jgi:hypothetical protein
MRYVVFSLVGLLTVSLIGGTVIIVRDLHRTLTDVDAAVMEAKKTMVVSQAAIANLQVMTNATLYSVGDASHELADMARVEKRAQGQQLARVNTIMDQATAVLANLDRNQQTIATDIHTSLQPIEPLLRSTQSTIIKTGGLADQIQSDLVQIQPALSAANVTTENLARTTKRIDDATAEAVAPKPWYKKLGVYSEAAAKLIVTFF